MLTRRQLIATGAVALAFSTVLLRRHRAHAATLRYQVTRSEEEWRRLLTPEQYDVLRKAGTERRYTSALLNEHRAGTFNCAGCDPTIFSSFSANTKFESGTGWPSFWAPLYGAVDETEDRSLGAVPYGGVVPQLRQPPRPRLRRWPEAHRLSLLHERRRLELRAGCRLTPHKGTAACVCAYSADRNASSAARSGSAKRRNASIAASPSPA